ncbi:MAG: hypothetical protein ACKO96_46240 [Flammeovirgaceae bacterium]
MELGKPITYYLTARYAEKLMVLFPDTSYKFLPFEFQRKSISPTRTHNGISYDSVVYTFATFEVDSVQSLQLPVFVLHEKDCTEILTEKSSVFFKTAIVLPDSVQLQNLPLKINTNYNPVAWLFNYPLASVVMGALLVLLVVLWILFGKHIQKHFQIKRLNKAHRSFLEQFNSQLEKTVLGSQTAAEMALITWKKYLENLSAKPFTKLTTKEIREAVGNDNLALALKDVDRVIYAGTGSERGPFEQLRKFSEEKYHEKLEEIKNG